MLFVAKCFFEGLCQRKHIVNGNAEEAMRKIAMVHPAPARKVKIAQMDVNLNVDLSIIVPVYNYADLIRNNIESILSQKTMYNYELILVDDGSTDGAREIVCSYIKDSRVKVICQKNQGIAFLHAGQERGRTKTAFTTAGTDDCETIGNFVKNSYDSSDNIILRFFKKFGVTLIIIGFPILLNNSL